MSSVMSCQSGPWVSMAMLLNNTHGDKGVYYLHGALQWQVNFTSPEDNRSSHTPGVLQSKTVEHSGRPRLLKVGYDISSQTQEQTDSNVDRRRTIWHFSSIYLGQPLEKQPLVFKEVPIYK